MMKLNKSRIVLYLLLFIFPVVSSSAQTKAAGKYITPLQIGDQLPETTLLISGNFHKQRAHFSDFKNKIIILDFWSSFCGACIGGFPNLQDLQDKFKDSIQIFFINPLEDSALIEQRMRNSPYYLYLHSNNILNIWNAGFLNDLLPHKYLGYVVWADKSGKIRVMGSELNNSYKKISQILHDEKFNYMADPVVYTNLDPPLCKNYSVNGEPMELRAISAYLPKYGTGGGIAIDTGMCNSSVRRITVVNYNVLELFAYSCETFFSKTYNKKIFSTSKVFLNDYFQLNVQDTLNFSSAYWGQTKRGRELATDENYIRSSYCYEQIVSNNECDSVCRKAMFSDLDNFFEKRLHVTINLRKVRVPCYSVVSGEFNGKNIIIKNSDEKLPVVPFLKNGQTWFHIYGGTIASSLQGIFSDELFNYNGIVLDKTGYGQRPIYLDVPGDEKYFKSLGEVRDFLHQYNLDLIPDFEDLDKIVISDTVPL